VAIWIMIEINRFVSYLAKTRTLLLYIDVYIF